MRRQQLQEHGPRDGCLVPALLPPFPTLRLLIRYATPGPCRRQEALLHTKAAGNGCQLATHDHLFALGDVALRQHGEGAAGVGVLHLRVAAGVVRPRQPCTKR